MPGNCRILVEFESRCVRLYLCNAAGKIIDEEGFAIGSEDTPEDSRARAFHLHAMLYDSLNYGINGASSKPPEKSE